jgi:hypothetical protein
MVQYIAICICLYIYGTKTFFSVAILTQASMNDSTSLADWVASAGWPSSDDDDNEDKEGRRTSTDDVKDYLFRQHMKAQKAAAPAACTSKYMDEWVASDGWPSSDDDDNEDKAGRRTSTDDAKDYPFCNNMKATAAAAPAACTSNAYIDEGKEGRRTGNERDASEKAAAPAMKAEKAAAPAIQGREGRRIPPPFSAGHESREGRRATAISLLSDAKRRRIQWRLFNEGAAAPAMKDEGCRTGN